MNKEIIILILVTFALGVHFVGQKQLLKNGLNEENPKRKINRLLINGSSLIAFSIFIFIAYSYPYSFFGLLMLIEGAICLAFAHKLFKKNK